MEMPGFFPLKDRSVSPAKKGRVPHLGADEHNRGGGGAFGGDISQWRICIYQRRFAFARFFFIFLAWGFAVGGGAILVFTSFHCARD